MRGLAAPHMIWNALVLTIVLAWQGVMSVVLISA
jgi:hypothetical protein